MATCSPAGPVSSRCATLTKHILLAGSADSSTPALHALPHALPHAQPHTCAAPPGKVGLRLSPYSAIQGTYQSDPVAANTYLMQQLSPLGLAYVHMVGGSERLTSCAPAVGCRPQCQRGCLDGQLYQSQRIDTPPLPPRLHCCRLSHASRSMMTTMATACFLRARAHTAWRRCARRSPAPLSRRAATRAIRAQRRCAKARQT